MIDLSTMNIILIVWTLAMFIVWSWLVVVSRRRRGREDGENSKGEMMDFTFWACVLSLLILAALWLS